VYSVIACGGIICFCVCLVMRKMPQFDIQTGYFIKADLQVYVDCIATRLCRIIAAGKMMKECALPKGVGIPQWRQGVSNPKLSDHWPVSIELQCPKWKRTRWASNLRKRRRMG